MLGDLCNVLIVDDEQLVRQGIKHFVNWEQEGFHIIGEAANGKEALELIEKVRPHIIITDIVMPLMDGEELTRKVKALYPEIEVIVLSSFGEFDYVRSSFQSGVADYILKPKLEGEALLQVLKSAAKKIPTLRLSRTAGDRALSIDDMIEKLIAGFDTSFEAETAARAFPHSGFCLICADLRMTASQEEQHLSELGKKLSRILENQLQSGKEDAIYHPFPGERNRPVFLLNADTQSFHAIFRTLGLVAKHSVELDPTICWLVADPFTSFDQMGRIYREGFTKLLQYRFYSPRHEILMEKDVKAPASPSPAFDLNHFTEELKRQHFDSAFAELREHVDAMSRQAAKDVFEFRSFLGNIIFNITVMLGNLGFETKELEEGKYAFFKAFEEAKNAQEAIMQLEAFIQKANLCIAARNQDATSSNMRMLLGYIEEHYAEPMTLSDAAKHFHFNPSYLSSYFSAHQKEGFNEYVTRSVSEKRLSFCGKGRRQSRRSAAWWGIRITAIFAGYLKRLLGWHQANTAKSFIPEKGASQA